MKKILFILLCCCFTSLMWGQSGKALRSAFNAQKAEGNIFFSEKLFGTGRLVENEFGTYSSLQLRTPELISIYAAQPTALSLLLPGAKGEILEIELVRVDMLSHHADFSVANASGIQSIGYGPGLFYRGLVKNAKHDASWAAITIFENGLMGVVATETGNWNIGPIKNDFSSNQYAFYNDQKQKMPLSYECRTPETDFRVEDVSKLKKQQQASVNCVDVFLVSDNDLYQNFGADEWQTINYLTGLFNVVATIYGNENISIRLSGVRVWNGADPYDETDSALGLGSFETDIQSNFTGDVAMLMAQDNNNGGRAVINFACGSNNARHGYNDIFGVFSNNLATYSWDVNVTAHELGHMLGSEHTHNCVWSPPIDNCGPTAGFPTEGVCADGPTPTVGTIMSYCHLVGGVGVSFVTSNGGGFGPQPAARIISYIDGQPCLGNCDCPVNIAAAAIPAVIPATVPPELEKFEASNNVVSNSTVNSGTFVKFDGGNLVRWTTGFHARSGSTVQAYIEGCGWLDGTDGTGSKPAGQRLAATASSDGVLSLDIFPNPATADFTISLGLETESLISIELIDQLGKQVRTMASSELRPAGTHTFLVSGGALESGVYFVRVQTDAFVQTRAVVLTR